MERLNSFHAKDTQAHLNRVVALPPNLAREEGKGTALHAHLVTKAHAQRRRKGHVTRKVGSLLRGGQRGEVVDSGHAASISRVKRTRKVYLFFLLCALRLTTRRLFDIIVVNALQ